MKQIGIIGAGASGLCALHHVLLNSGMKPIVWEHSSDVGGTWVYTDKIGTDEYGYQLHSSMYKNLRTNLPKEIMAFPDFKFKDGGKSFIHHSEVLRYLHEYADHFNLKPWIKFRYHVDSIEPASSSGPGGTRWAITSTNMLTSQQEKVHVDAVLVCNGHYSKPLIPHIEDMGRFGGRKMHSHDYRDPSEYLGLAVLVLGAAASGIDISLEIANVAKKVYLSHNLPIPFPSKFPPNVEQVKGVDKATEGGFILKDGHFVMVDAILFCTGYEYNFPFLSDSCGIEVKDGRVTPLYKHIINCYHPSMGFIGIPSKICPFPLFDVQVRYFLGVANGSITLTRQDLRTHEYSDPNYSHVMLHDQWRYCDELNEAVGHRAYPSHYHDIWAIVLLRLAVNLTDFKNFQYELREKTDGNFSVVETRDGSVVWTKLDLLRLVLGAIFRTMLNNGRDLIGLIIKIAGEQFGRRT